MPFYALSTIPLIRRLQNSVTQAWYTDDASAEQVVDMRGGWAGLTHTYFYSLVK